MRTTRGAAFLAATALAVSGLAACGDEGESAESSTTASPSAVSESSTESSGSESSSAKAPESSQAETGSETPDLPKAATKQTQSGAAAFGKYYYEQFGEANRTGSTETIELLDSQECLVCRDGVEEIQADAKKGWTRSKNPYSFSQVKATKRPDEGYKVAMQIKVSPHERVDSSGEANAKIEATKYTLTLHVLWESGRWQVADWVIT